MPAKLDLSLKNPLNIGESDNYPLKVKIKLEQSAL